VPPVADAPVETAIDAALRTHRPQLERLIRERVDALIVEFVERELAGRTNSNDPAVDPYDLERLGVRGGRHTRICAPPAPQQCDGLCASRARS
jgi:hypothetical protein